MELLERIYKRLLAHTDTDFYRYLYDKIDWSQPLIGIKGQRGVGKTTMMLQRIKTTYRILTPCNRPFNRRSLATGRDV